MIIEGLYEKEDRRAQVTGYRALNFVDLQQAQANNSRGFNNKTFIRVSDMIFL